jgi:hypothetical protein
MVWKKILTIPYYCIGSYFCRLVPKESARFVTHELVLSLLVHRFGINMHLLGLVRAEVGALQQHYRYLRDLDLYLEQRNEVHLFHELASFPLSFF